MMSKLRSRAARTTTAALAAMALAAALFLASCVTDQEARRLAASWDELGKAWADQGRWDRAGAAWSEALRIDPTLGTAGFNLIRALTEAGKYDEAIANARKFLDKDPDNAEVLSALAYAYYKAGRFDEAIETYQRVVDLRAEDLTSLFNLAALLEKAGRRTEAAERYRGLLQEDPENAAVSFRLGVLLVAEHRELDAIPYIEAYIAAKPDVIDGKKALAMAQEGAGLYAKAMETWALVCAKAPEDAASWFALARLRLTIASDGTGGLEALKKALDAGFTDDEAAKALLATESLAARDEVTAALAAKGLPRPADATTGEAGAGTPTVETGDGSE